MRLNRTTFAIRLEGTVFATVLKVLSLASPSRSLAAILGLTLSNIIEIVGLTLLIPIFSLALFGAGDHLSRKAGIILQIEEWLGIGIPSSLATLIGIFVAVLVVKSLIIIIVTRMNARIVSLVTRSVRIRLIKSLLGARWGYFVDQKVGHLNNLVTTEASLVGDTFDVAVAYCTSILQIGMFVILALAISWELAAFFLALGPLIFFVFARLLKWSKKAAYEDSQAVHTLSSAFVDVLVNMKAIKAMNLEGTFTRDFLRDAKTSERSQRMKVFSADFARELQEPIIACAMVLFLLLAVRHFGTTSSGVLVLGLIFVRTADVFYNIQRMHHRLTLRSVNLEGVLLTAQWAEFQVEPSSGTLRPTLSSSLQFEGVTFKYPNEQVALKEFSLKIPVGSMTVVVGPSGAGKTTLLDLVLGLQQPTSGLILIDGTPLPEIDMSAWRRMIGYMPQEASLFNATIRMNVVLGDEAVSEERIWRALSLAGATGFVESLPSGLDYIVGERGLALSGGQRQRIALARSLLHNPKLLVFDEATSALDPATEEEIGRHLAKVAKDLGLTVIAVTHRPYWVEIADQVVTVEDGVVTTAAGPKLRLELKVD